MKKYIDKFMSEILIIGTGKMARTYFRHFKF